MSPPTPEQRRALDTPGAQVAVAAGAGSGKTTLLVEAVWEDLETAGVPLDRLFVATYNRAAAAHLIARIQSRFADPAAGRAAGRATLDLSAAWIGTLHSLCGRIVREHPFAAGVDPDFTELDETASAALVEAALDEALEATRDAGFDDLLARTWGPRPIRDDARAAHERLRAAGHETPRLRVPEPRGDPTVAAVAVRRAAAALTAASDLDDHRRAADEAVAMADAQALAPAPPRARLNCAAPLRPVAGALNDAVAHLVAALADRAAAPQLRGFAAFLESFGRAYERRKRDMGALDYEDLQLAARRVLRRGSPYHFMRVYVDEFQDANDLQDEILGLLGAERTLVVGDGSQAIYGFRHANAGRFMARAGTPPRVALTDNHRSAAELLDALNAWLGEVLRDDPAFARLTAAARPDPAAPALRDPPAELVTVDAEAGREGEAAVVASLVAERLADGHRPRDVVVLFRALTDVAIYDAALRATGIRTHLVAGRGFFAHAQVADALALLRLVENPLDEPALVRVLASPYVAASDDELAALRVAAGRRGPLWPAVPTIPGLAAAAVTVAGLRALPREVGLAGLVEAATTAAGYELAALGLEEGPRRFANLRRLVRLAESFAAVRGPDLRGFLALLDEQADRVEDPGEAVLVDPELDAVRLSTIHGVKGQEFPVVILADASRAPRPDTPIVRVAADGRAAIRLQRHGEQDNVPALGYADLQAEAAAAEAAEERRVAYVALTRARRHVAVVGRGGSRSTSAHRLLADALPAAGPRVRDRRSPAPPAVAAPAWPPPPAPMARSVAEPPEPSRAEIDPLRGRRLSASALAGHAACSLRFHLEAILGLRGRPGDAVAAPGGGAWGGAALGDLVHRRLAAHDWSGPPPPAGWAAPAAAGAGLTPSVLEAARAERLAAAAVAGRLGARIVAGRAAFERSFALEVDGVLLVGALDVMVREPGGGALVVDWKTHRLEGRTPEALMAGYRLQRALYGLAALREGHPRVELAWCFLEAPDDPQTLVVGSADGPALRAEVAGALAAVRRDPPAPATRTPLPVCSGCPGRRAFCPVSGHEPAPDGGAG